MSDIILFTYFKYDEIEISFFWFIFRLLIFFLKRKEEMLVLIIFVFILNTSITTIKCQTNETLEQQKCNILCVLSKLFF